LGNQKFKLLMASGLYFFQGCESSLESEWFLAVPRQATALGQMRTLPRDFFFSLDMFSDMRPDRVSLVGREDGKFSTQSFMKRTSQGRIF
jgi:hypothetical protein